MRRTFPLVAVPLLVLTFAALPASAAPPLHERFEFSGTFDPGADDPDTNPFEVPEICDFDYVQTYSGIANVTTWGDADDFDKQIWTGPLVITHTNATTGQVLVEKVSYTVILTDNGATDVETGVFWHLRDADTGKLVIVKAGRLAWDNVAGTLTYTPNTDQGDFWSIICPALGGVVA